MRTLSRINQVSLSFLLSFLIAAITIPLTISLTNGYEASLSSRALSLIVGMGITALITILVVLILAWLIQSFYNREVDRLDKETLRLKQYTEYRRWEHRFSTYYLDPAYQKSQIRRSRRKFTG